MEAREFRLGNYFMSNIVQQIGIEHLEFLLNENFDHSVMKPIPITEEWLLKFGFFKMITKDGGYIKPINSTFSIDSDDFLFDLKHKQYIFYTLDLLTYHGKEINYVHELQNLYYALTGEELTIKH